MMNNKYECKSCGSSVKNSKANIASHNKTAKHLKSLTGEEPEYKNDDETRAKLRSRWHQHKAKAKSTIGDDEWKYRQSLRKWLQRNPNKSEADYTPRGKRVKKVAQPVVKVKEEVEQSVVKIKEDFKPEFEIKAQVVDKPKQQKIQEASLTLREPSLTLREPSATLRDNLFDSRDNLLEKLSNVAKVQKKSLLINVNRIANLYKFYTGNDWEYKSLTWVRDTEKIYEFVMSRVEWKSTKTKGNQFTSLAGILRYIPTYDKEQQIYSRMCTNIQDEIDSGDLADNILNARQKKLYERSNKSGTYINWSDILAVRDTLRDSNGGTSFHRALFDMYTMMPPRRLDYRLMKIVKNQKKFKPNKTLNYIFVDDNNLPTKIVIYEYKSGAKKRWSNKHRDDGSYKANLPLLLQKSLQSYINDEGLVNNDYLFGLNTNHKASYPDTSFGTLISVNIFETFFGRRIGVNDLRRLYTSWYWPNTKTTSQQERLAFAMGSSPSEFQRSYFKVELVPPEE